MGARRVVPVLLAAVALVALLVMFLTAGPTVPQLERTSPDALVVLLAPEPAKPAPTTAALAVVPGEPVPVPVWADPDDETDN